MNNTSKVGRFPDERASRNAKYIMTNPQLDFIHLNNIKKQGKLKQTLDQEVAYADPANGIYHDPGSLCETVLEAHLETCEDSADGRYSFSC